MRKFNFYRLGISLGLIPIMGLGLMFFIFWSSLTFFAHDIDIEGIGFLYIMISIPIVFIGFILTFISIFKRNTKIILKPIIGIALILLNMPILDWILRTSGEVSGRAYLKVINNSGSNIDTIVIKEPNDKKTFGGLDQGSSTVIYLDPDYVSPDGRTYPGISENLLIITIHKKRTDKKIPIIHPGETHKIVIDKNLNLTDIHLNKVLFNE